MRRYALPPYKWLLSGTAAIALAATAWAAPPGETDFGVYDPHGSFTEDPDVQVEHLFLPWEDLFIDSLADADRYAMERGRRVLVTIEPWTWTRDARNTPAQLISGIDSGSYDGNMIAICRVLAEFESDVTVRWAQEMDDYSGQFIWAGWQPDTYIRAYKRVIDLCREEAPDITVMWSPLGYENMADYYPGDGYADVIGLSVFGLQAWEHDVLGAEQSFASILQPRYQRALQFGKPVVVAELGYSGDRDYVEKWEGDVRQSGGQFPELAAVVYFNQTEVYPWPDGYGLPDWRVEHRVVEQQSAEISQ
ncbi:glycoside hydrolase family 26 protein [Roseobacteraceae bacterium NS-SX3]